MSLLVAQGTATVLILIALVHLYWALGGQLGSEAVVPHVAGAIPGQWQPAFRPAAWITALVALGLLLIALLVCLRVGLFLPLLGQPWLQWLISAIALLMFARAIGDSSLVGFFKEPSPSRFARLDSLVYSPLCVALGAGLLVVAWN
ncbi:DUF3995 domain-containing protein [Pseudomonas sp. CF161]|uniref:DUF3995 domain-containing protein n=1 Tax=Pseudomonas sp. CF161 TaxID=911241 RepID=UPI0005B958BF|nr:DUF3995 domain-containing protein [Pseudomonas sp. CF161]